MTEVAAVRGTNRLTVVSTFSGCGGSCLGFEMAGYNVRWANEFIPEAQNTYRINHPQAHLDTRDIRTVTGAEILAQTGIAPGELDVLEGSPPCASFSMSGNREADWGRQKKYSDSRQRTDDLFFEYTRLLRELQPRAFVAENVAGLVVGNAWGYFEAILVAMREAGYRVVARRLDAQWLGVPQARPRMIFVGVRNDIECDPAHPPPLGYRYSLRDAVPDIEEIDPPRFEAFHKGPRDISGMSIGPMWRELLANGRGHRKRFNLIRPDPNRPAPTLLATAAHDSAASVCHPFIPRKFNTFELRRLCAFPDDFELTGQYQQKYERLARAVPPLMMWRVARTLRDEVFAPLGRVAADAQEIQL